MKGGGNYVIELRNEVTSVQKSKRDNIRIIEGKGKTKRKIQRLDTTRHV